MGDEGQEYGFLMYFLSDFVNTNLDSEKVGF